MIKLLTVIPLTICVAVFGQPTTKTETAIQTVNRIFKGYIRYAESTDSQENKDAMTKALKSLQQPGNGKDLKLLIDVWMYYDPTDFPTRELIEPILNKDKPAAIIAIEKRLKKKKKWENIKTAPLSDLISLKEKLSK